jgi:hypothetical protein
MGRKTLPGGGSPLSIRISDKLKTDLVAAASELGMTEHDTLRLAMQIGFKHFVAIDYDLAETIVKHSGLLPPKPTAILKPQASGKVYEFPSDNGFKVAEEHHKDEAHDGMH